MNLKDFFIKQLAYSDAMNLTQLGRLKELEHPPLEAVELLSHIAKAELLWLGRLYGNDTFSKNFRESWSLPEIEDHLRDSHRGWISFLNEIDENGLNKVFEYKNLRGEHFEDNLYDIIFHVINHS